MQDPSLGLLLVVGGLALVAGVPPVLKPQLLVVSQLAVQ